MCLKTGRPVAGVDTLLRYDVGNAQYEFKQLDELQYTYQRYPNRYQDISQSEKDKRIQQIADLRVKVENAIVAGNSVLGINPSQPVSLQPSDLESNKPTYEIEGKDNRQLLTMQKQMLRNQDNDLDEVGGIVKVIKIENENFGHEVNLQTKMLTGLNQRVDKTTSKLQRVDDRLKSMVNKRSTMFYYGIIAVEIVAIILVLSI